MSLKNAIKPQILAKNRMRMIQDEEFCKKINQQVSELKKKFPNKSAKAMELILLSRHH